MIQTLSFLSYYATTVCFNELTAKIWSVVELYGALFGKIKNLLFFLNYFFRHCFVSSYDFYVYISQSALPKDCILTKSSVRVHR